jgi:hypothetical protein
MRKIIFFSCVLLAILCIGGGLVLTGAWLAGLAAVLPAGVLLIRSRWPSAGHPTIALAGWVGLAGAGLLLRAAPALMLVGTAAGLAAWDLAQMARQEELASERGAALERRHYQYLALALGLGLLAALGGLSLRIQVPFIIVALLVGLLLFGLDRALRELRR